MRKKFSEIGALIALLITLVAICLPAVMIVIGVQWIIPSAQWRFNVGGAWTIPLWCLAVLIMIPILDIATGVIARVLIILGIRPSMYWVSTIGGIFLFSAVLSFVLTPFYACLIAALICATLNKLLEPSIPVKKSNTESTESKH